MSKSRATLAVLVASLLLAPFPMILGCNSKTTPTQSSPSAVHANRTLVWWQRPGIRGGTITFAKPDTEHLTIVDRSITFENAVDSLTVSYRLAGVEENVDIYDFELIPNGAGPVQRTVRYTGGSTVVYELSLIHI